MVAIPMMGGYQKRAGMIPSGSTAPASGLSTLSMEPKSLFNASLNFPSPSAWWLMGKWHWESSTIRRKINSTQRCEEAEQNSTALPSRSHPGKSLWGLAFWSAAPSRAIVGSPPAPAGGRCPSRSRASGPGPPATASTPSRQSLVPRVLDGNVDLLCRRVQGDPLREARPVRQAPEAGVEADGIFLRLEIARDTNRQEAVGDDVDFDAQCVARLDEVAEIETSSSAASYFRGCCNSSRLRGRTRYRIEVFFTRKPHEGLEVRSTGG